MNFLTWEDGLAFADWAGLRPMTELEFEKAIAVDGDENVIVAALYNLTVDADPSTNGAYSVTSAGGTDVILAKYTPAGALLWAHGFGSADPGGTVNNIAAGLALDAEGSAFIPGQFHGPDADFDPSDDTAALTSNWTAETVLNPTGDGYILHTNATGFPSTKFLRVEGP